MHLLKNILYSLILFSATSMQAMLVKQLASKSQFYRHAQQLSSRRYCDVAIKKESKKNLLLKSRILNVITNNLCTQKDAHSWHADVNGLVKAFPKQKDLIYNTIDELVFKNNAYIHPKHQEKLNFISSLTKCALFPCLAGTTAYTAAHAAAWTALFIPIDVGAPLLERLAIMFIGAPCAWGVTAILYAYTHHVGSTISFRSTPEAELNRAVQKYNNIRVLQKILKQHRAKPISTIRTTKPNKKTKHKTKKIQHKKNYKSE